jgi:hypothetical protein
LSLRREESAFFSFSTGKLSQSGSAVVMLVREEDVVDDLPTAGEFLQMFWPFSIWKGYEARVHDVISDSWRISALGSLLTRKLEFSSEYSLPLLLLLDLKPVGRNGMDKREEMKRGIE